MNYGHGYGCDPCYPGYGYPTQVAPVAVGCGHNGGFALIVVLFILLIIIGASFCNKGC